MIEIADLWKAFGSLPVLKGVSLRVERGSVVAIIGPSGSGKSTLLRCINLLEDPDRGRISVGDHEMRFGDGTQGTRRGAKPGDRELAAFRAATGMVFQHFNLFPHMTALGNVMAGPTFVKRTARREAEDIGRGLLAKVGLADKAGVYPSHLSGGQRQRVAIARAWR
jgi:polar amino acid transport system ATP-binding protein